MGNSLYLGGNVGFMHCNRRLKNLSIGIDKVYERDGSLTIDGLSYRTARMPDGSVWMCENCQASQGSSSFYDNNESKYGRAGKNYGRLYVWQDAVNLASRIPGWHLPSTDEWSSLINAFGKKSNAGIFLKSSSDWEKGPGTDDFCFSVLPSGYKNVGTSYSVGNNARIWCSTEYSASTEKALYQDFGTSDSSYSYVSYKSYFAFSVRLVKD